jgi:anti-anti-sigma factor
MSAGGEVADVVPSPWDGHHLLLGPVEGAPTGVVGWAERGLARGDKLLYAGSAHSGIDELVAVLAEAGLDAAAAAEQGRLECAEPARFYSETGYPALVAEARRQGFVGARTFGGPAAAEGLLDRPGFDRFERVLERMWSAEGVTAVCCYAPVVADEPAELGRAVARHTSGWSGWMLQAHSPRAGRLRLLGEIDASNDWMLPAVCSRAVERATELVVECDELVFMSVSGWRVLATATAGFREGGGSIRLTGLTALTARTLEMMGYQQVFELELAR